MLITEYVIVETHLNMKYRYNKQLVPGIDIHEESSEKDTWNLPGTHNKRDTLVSEEADKTSVWTTVLFFVLFFMPIIGYCLYVIKSMSLSLSLSLSLSRPSGGSIYTRSLNSIQTSAWGDFAIILNLARFHLQGKLGIYRGWVNFRVTWYVMNRIKFTVPPKM